MNQLLHRIADTSLSHDERARLRCQLSKEFEDSGNYEAAREAMGELWSCVGERPSLEGLEREIAAEVLLRSGVVTGQLGSVKQIETAQEIAKNLISESLSIFEALEDSKKVAEARIELAQCYWREGAYDEARVMLAEALGRLGVADGKLKAIALYRSAIVAKLSSRHNDALRYYNEAAPFFEEITNDALRGKFHNGFANLLACLGQTEGRNDYIDRAFIEYAAAGFHFERAGQARHHACVENNLGYLFCTISKFTEAHNHLDRAQAIFTSLRDDVHLAQVDETRARVFLAEGRVGDAEKLARAAVGVLERGGEQSLLAEALTTQGTALARGGQYEQAGEVLLRAAEVAEAAGDVEGAGQAALTLIEELGERLALQDLADSFERADALLAKSRHPGNRNRLYACARLVLSVVGVLPEPDTWEGFSFREAVRRYEGRLIEGALRDSEGVVSRAAQLLGLTRQSLDAMLHRRHRRLLPLRTPAEPRRSSLMFREPDEEAETRPVHILHAEDDALVASAVREALRGEGWRVSTYADGPSALREIEGEEPYDLLIIDKQLPGADGLELVCRARELPHRQNVPVVVLSASDAGREARRAGASAFLRKPEDMDALAETIARLLARKPKQG
jgi:CheY-like chemotaxis protein/Tfp pilus assembly protein PilF